MFKRVLDQLRERIRARQYIVLEHARMEMNSDDLNISIYDIERCILNGRIIERQRDRETRKAWNGIQNIRQDDKWARNRNDS